MSPARRVLVPTLSVLVVLAACSTSGEVESRDREACGVSPSLLRDVVGPDAAWEARDVSLTERGADHVMTCAVMVDGVDRVYVDVQKLDSEQHQTAIEQFALEAESPTGICDDRLVETEDALIIGCSAPDAANVNAVFESRNVYVQYRQIGADPDLELGRDIARSVDASLDERPPTGA